MTADRHSAIYDDLMRFKPENLTPNAWAVLAGVSRTVWSDMRRHGNPSRRTLEKLLHAVGSSLAEFEALRVGEPQGKGAAGISAALADRNSEWGAPQLPGLPLVATAIGEGWPEPGSKIELTEIRSGELLDRVPRPVSLASDATAYAITIVGDSMWPRFRPGRRVAVSAKAPVSVGDDVLVKLKPAQPGTTDSATSVLIKELVRKSGTGIELRQFNPDATFEVPASEIAAIERVLGELF
jgi:hypothetical protein